MSVLHQILFAWSQMWPTASNACNIDWNQKVDPMRNSLVFFLSASWQQMRYWIYWRPTYLTLKIAMMTSSMWHSFLHRSKLFSFRWGFWFVRCRSWRGCYSFTKKGCHDHQENWPVLDQRSLRVQKARQQIQEEARKRWNSATGKSAFPNL